MYPNFGLLRSLVLFLINVVVEFLCARAVDCEPYLWCNCSRPALQNFFGKGANSTLLQLPRPVKEQENGRPPLLLPRGRVSVPPPVSAISTGKLKGWRCSQRVTLAALSAIMPTPQTPAAGLGLRLRQLVEQGQLFHTRRAPGGPKIHQQGPALALELLQGRHLA